MAPKKVSKSTKAKVGSRKAAPAKKAEPPAAKSASARAVRGAKRQKVSEAEKVAKPKKSTREAKKPKPAPKVKDQKAKEKETAPVVPVEEKKSRGRPKAVVKKAAATKAPKQAPAKEKPSKRTPSKSLLSPPKTPQSVRSLRSSGPPPPGDLEALDKAKKVKSPTATKEAVVQEGRVTRRSSVTPLKEGRPAKSPATGEKRKRGASDATPKGKEASKKTGTGKVSKSGSLLM